MKNMTCLLAGAVALLQTSVLSPSVHAAEEVARTDTIRVVGRGEVEAAPDQAVLRLGATVQAPNAADAQNQVNQIMNKAIAAIRALQIPDSAIRTVRVQLEPVFSVPEPVNRQRREPVEPKIVGYQANNSIQIQIDELAKVGRVIDAGVGAGANQIEDLSFQLRDETPQRQAALRQAASAARAKATAIAEAMDLNLKGVSEVIEEQVQVFRPRMELAFARTAADAASTPVQPGQIRIEATLIVYFHFETP